MSNEVAWLLLWFAIMVVAVLVTMHEKIETLERRLRRLEGDEETDDEQRPSAGPTRARIPRLGSPRMRYRGER